MSTIEYQFEPLNIKMHLWIEMKTVQYICELLYIITKSLFKMNFMDQQFTIVEIKQLLNVYKLQML